MKDKNLEKKILKGVYRLETKRTTTYLLIRVFFGLLFLLSTFVFASVTIDILNEQNSFDLLDFFRDDFEVIKKYLFENLIDFFQEIPQPLFYVSVISILLVLATVFILVKNFKKIKNKLVAIYKFQSSKDKTK
ncbi:MAG: hypothetical protein US40_C0007G0022 [Candidatus Roizmanbacteria bacterium GW2011_GWC2_37_13]|uniref:Uncharacterized protein n=1 Tax=Candidatus Roizmanbacteria bacterium GW2011_GWC2_37_13 TaxID=1618486 RepID=A0A0G0G2W0_9BACT|nr:MAG: hypothetical protein US38_C0012G0025 [Candidatus Roizmanbacteria bacterium GW2011_GWC1_37_12]KKQ25523.1 MAG: hypothetical protein US40_C0007G0022 [Candidatus Roizmanbacteria bacterium GW2011_GWC2_37_13]